MRLTRDKLVPGLTLNLTKKGIIQERNVKLLECVSTLRDELDKTYLKSEDYYGVHEDGSEMTSNERYYSRSRWKVDIDGFITHRWIDYYFGGISSIERSFPTGATAQTFKREEYNRWLNTYTNLMILSYHNTDNVSGWVTVNNLPPLIDVFPIKYVGHDGVGEFEFETLAGDELNGELPPELIRYKKI